MSPVKNQIPCGYLEFNDEGTLTQVNNRLCSILGYNNKQLANNHIETILSSGAEIFYQTHLFPMLKMEKQANEIYLTLQSKEGKHIPVLINADRTVENNEAINRCIVVQMERRSEYEDRILYDKMKAQKKSDKKEKLLSMMSHELRSPLNAILGMVDLLSEEINGEAQSDERKYLGLIKNAGKDLARLADDILNFAKLESGYFEVNKEVVLLEEVLMNSVMMTMPDADDKGIELIRSEKTELKLLADKDRLKQVIINLLTNAVKYTEQGGKVTLSTDKEEQFAKIQVKDTGIGIPSDKIDHIFQPFNQMDNNNSGSSESGFGLGLPISKKLVNFMEGELTVSSKEGEGSIFSVKIPLAEN
ncbi:PAS domain S-box-containing protein [Fodinibius salinus]|uniref:histidine kinase n=1 Tax=Fodinibius salinus TaxID=860790 RepID=A0A5D3YLP1_9BACT|nr:HAMP domain-containing sensor histidine kinase [Fodinibius salinus]TYP93617.1 PAS domain S-box-containing protein [Fodinibius salinus]